MGVGSVIGGILSQGAGPVMDGLAKIIQTIKGGTSPEDAVKLQEIITKHQDVVLATDAELEKARREENVRLNEIAGQNVRADAQSGDKFVSRARPAVIWVGLVMLCWNFMLLPLLVKYGIHPVDFPPAFWETWGIVVTGIVFTRSFDKLMGGKGGSVNLPFGVKMDSKGD